MMEMTVRLRSRDGDVDVTGAERPALHGLLRHGHAREAERVRQRREFVERETEVDERGERHVAADPRGRVDVEELHRRLFGAAVRRSPVTLIRCAA
jgi:hypothetical protein